MITPDTIMLIMITPTIPMTTGRPVDAASS